MSEDDDESDPAVERDIILLRRGFELHERFNAAMIQQEEARDAAIEAAKARGEKPDYSPTGEEKAWDAYHDRALAGIAVHHRDVLEYFSLDPQKSVLSSDFPDLLDMACDPQTPVLYDPAIRRFALMETWGPAVRVISHCPWTGKELPRDLNDEWHDLIDVLMGNDDWSTDDARDKLATDYFCETWWVQRGL